MYPTVGLQTPGEMVEANFGQQPFVFDIEDYMQVCFSTRSFQPFLTSHLPSAMAQCQRLGHTSIVG